ncbi:aspartyl protease [Nitrosospira sp. Nsp2]|uniref:retropepsin-like aspartic protease n=1 Tax=Nitrosospira sp. Nsp2 TaxID=136548 RepID=UPI000D2FD44F|nr:retropepsin-like aspartic protease [Nitrosospira sp. Nsp2]PTR16962.1 aspartyl protease [Nitrosospira sp. Nsp2]
MNRSFTITTENGLLTSLGTPCHVSHPFNPANGIPECERIEFNACWDTGATKSVITRRVVEALGLKPMKSIRGYLQGVDGGVEKSEAYVINLSLPSKITFHELIVISKSPGDVWWDVLIGMDIISAGKFSVKNVNSNTEWSFSVTPQKGSI